MKVEKQQTEIRTFLLPLALDDGTASIFLLFSQNQVVEILGRRSVRKVPFSPAYLKGVIPYFDRILPVIAVGALCGQKQARSKEEFVQLIVVRTGATDPVSGESLKAAIVADRRVRIARFSGQMLASGFVEQEAPDFLQDSGILKGYFRRQNNGVAVIDLSRVVLGVHGNSVLPAQSVV